jgi:hypothetical protein
MAKHDYDSMNVAELKDAAHARGLPGVDQLKKAELVEALEADDKASGGGPAARSPRDNRKILQGVQIMQGSTLTTFAGDDVETLDALEKVMTAEQCERLKEQGALEGDWSPAGEPAAPMVNSRAAKEARGR